MAKVAALTILIICLALLAAPGFAADDAVRWNALETPSDGKSGGWVLAAGSDVRYLTRTADGTLYAYANPSGTPSRLFKSADNGRIWSATGDIEETITAISAGTRGVSPLVAATASKVYRSNDGGATFTLLPMGPGGAGAGNVQITSVAVTGQGSRALIAVGTRDADAGQYGGVFIFDETRAYIWQDTAIGGYDVYAVAFSPDYESDEELVAIATDEIDTVVTSRVGDGGWGQRLSSAALNRDNQAPAAPVSAGSAAAIAFPDGYSARSETPVLFVTVDSDTGTGDVYRMDRAHTPAASRATDLNIGDAYGMANVDGASLQVSGSGPAARVVVGAAGSAQVYLSGDGGKTWSRSEKPPTGQSDTFVVLDTLGQVYAATSGADSAFSASSDGLTWSQTGLIDAAITGLLDFAVSPDFGQDNGLGMLTFGGGRQSLWITNDGGRQWERSLSSSLTGVDSLSRLKISPRSAGVIYLTGVSGGKPGVWKSADGGRTFAFLPTNGPGGTPFTVDAWAVLDDTTLLLAGYDGTNGILYRTSNSGLTFSSSKVGVRSLYSIAFSPDYARDGHVLVGNTFGEIFLSNDRGVSFEAVPGGTPPLTGNVSVAFDPDYPRNHIVYAASDSAGKGIWAFTTGKSRAWESIDAALPAGATLTNLGFSASGTLYAVNSKANGGMERTLDASYSLGPTFEQATRGLDSGAVLSGLWIYGHRVWSINTAASRILSYDDTLTEVVRLTSPAENASGVELKNMVLDWETLDGATKYRWQIDYDGSFVSVPAGFSGDTEASSARLPALEPGLTYHWRVRAIEPVLSPWSARASFTTTLGSGETAPQPLAPAAGTLVTSPRALLQWEAVPGATSYEVVLARDPAFGEGSQKYTVPANAWQSPELSHDTMYFWKVRAVSAQSASAWSPVSAFTVGPRAVAQPAPSPQPPAGMLPGNPAGASAPAPIIITSAPVPVTVNNTIGELGAWVGWLGGGLLGVLVAILVTLIVLTRRLG